MEIFNNFNLPNQATEYQSQTLMTVLYVDNFRGFESSYIPLKTVNFFVGENSTGKSSVLKLIGILSSQGFWRYNIFGEKETALGNFAEIITLGSEKAHFEVAFIGPKYQSSDTHSAIKIRFIEKDGYPTPKEISYKDNCVNLQITIEGRFLKYRYQLSDPKTPVFGGIDDFRDWIKDNQLYSSSFQRVSLDITSPLPILRQLERVILTENSNKVYIDSVDIAIPYMLDNVAWFAPSVAAPEKVYNLVQLVFSPTGEHFATLLRDIIEGPNVKAILNRFGQDSGLYEDIEIINLKTTSEDAFEIRVTVGHKKLNIANVGYGVSQILPFILEAVARPDYTWLLSQQPETHLHPRAQTAVGEFIFKSNQIDHQKFILETHSDYIIDRYRIRLNKAFKKKEQYETGQVLFFSRNIMGNQVSIIDIQPDGSYAAEQPEEFRDFFLNEQLNLLTI